MPNSNIFSTLTATGTKDVIALKTVSGSTPQEYKINFINEVINTRKYRSITARESGKLQGFPDWFSFHKDTRLAKKQFGNAVSTNVIHAVANELVKLNLFKK
jgi:DNA (cytosine-5)-methyltransferase 1